MSERPYPHPHSSFGHFLISAERDLLGKLTHFADVRISGQENYPEIAKGPAIISLFPHTSHLDSYLVRASLPPEVSHNLVFAAKASAWGTGLKSHIGKLVTDFIPLDTDCLLPIKAMREMLRRLKNGEYLVLSPEGTRTQLDAEDRQFQPGIAWLLYKMGYKIPIVPIILHGPGDILPKGASLLNLFHDTGKHLQRKKVLVHVGEPFWHKPDKAMQRDQLIEKVTSDLRRKSIAMYKELDESIISSRL